MSYQPTRNACKSSFEFFCVRRCACRGPSAWAFQRDAVGAAVSSVDTRFVFEPHENVPQPNGEDSVWRYMDLAKLISLLDRSALYFACAAVMVDRWEGSLGSFGVPLSIEDRRHNIELNRETTYLNCWHLSEYESAAMWDIYQRDGRGVAIRTTWKDLTASVTSPWPIAGGTVTYVDAHGSSTQAMTFEEPFMVKRKSFEHEREARLTLWANGAGGPDERRGRHPEFDQDVYYSDKSTARPGHHVDVDLNRLVKWIYVAPDAPQWFEEAVTGLVGRYGHGFAVVRSDLYSDPFLN